MPSIPEMLPYIQFVGQVALIAAASFAGTQFLLARRQRDDHNALQVLSRLASPEFRIAYARVRTLPVDATPDQIREQGPDMEEAVDVVAMTVESLGVMVHNRMVPLDVVDQAIGGFLRESWRRLRSTVEWQREVYNAPRLSEWYQWLAERIIDRRGPRRTIPAYEAFRHWRP